MTSARHFPITDSVLKLLQQVWLPVALVMAWWFGSLGSTSYYFPPLKDILATLFTDLASGTLGASALVSLVNLLSGLVIASVIGIVAGLFIGTFALLRDATAPVLNFLRAVPPASIVPIVIVAMGSGSAPKIFIVALGCFWPVLLNTIDGVRGTPPAVGDTVRGYKIPLWLALCKVSFFAALPQIMAGIRVAIAVALVLMVISEFYGATAGLGFYILDSSQRFAIKAAWAGTLVVGVLGYVLSALFLVFERRVLSWYFQDDTRGRMTAKRSSGG